MSFDEEYFKSEDFREILESYETSMNQGESPFMDVDDLVDIADYYNWKGYGEQADEAIEHALELYPDATLPNVYRARQALMDGNYEEARSFCQNIANREDPDYHYLVAEIMIAEGRIDEADNYLKAYGTTVDDDEREDFIRDCANLFVDYDVSSKAYEWMAKSKDDDSDDFKELAARTLFSMGKYKDSERLFNELIDRHPYSKHYWNALASAQLMNEDPSAAVTSSEYAIAIDPNDPDALFSKANGLLKLGNYPEALKYYQRYAEKEPDDELAQLNEAVCHVNMGQTTEAIEHLQKAARLCPADSVYLPQIYQELALCYSSRKEPEAALQVLDKTEALECDHIDMLVIRGHILMENYRNEEAEEAFSKAIELSDYAPGVMLRIIISLFDNHYTEDCYEMFLKFFDLIGQCYPDFHDGYAYMALCCYETARVKEFLHYLRLAVQHNPQEAQLVLSNLFPQGTKVSDYVSYVERKITNEKS